MSSPEQLAARKPLKSQLKKKTAKKLINCSQLQPPSILNQIVVGKMGKSDDSIARRKNRKTRRKQESKSKVSTRVASIIAAKKRRLTGKRRMCQGMCYSLPTPEDPFNDRHGKAEEPFKKKKRDFKTDKKHADKRLKKGRENGIGSLDNLNSSFVSDFSFMGPEIVTNLGKRACKIIKRQGSTCSVKKCDFLDNTEGPSKFLLMCLNSIQDTMQQGEDLDCESDRPPLFANEWGFEFWNSFTNGKDILESGGVDPAMQKIAWMASTAADAISLKETEGVSFAGPFLLYLVPSQEKTHKVREVCKALKTTGIHSVCLHSGASIEHQTAGLKSCEPEFLISTPDRLLELLDKKAVDISDTSLLIIDGLEAPFKGDYFEAVKSIRQFITGDLRTVVFCDSMNGNSNSTVQKLEGKDGSNLKRSTRASNDS